MKCKRCGCEIEGLAWSLSEYEKGTTTNTHLTSDNCISALRRQLDALQPKPERFATIREFATGLEIPSWNMDAAQSDVRNILQAFDEAVEACKGEASSHRITVNNAIVDWLDKWGNK